MTASQLMDHPFSIVIPYHAHPNTIDFVKRQLNYYYFNTTPMAVVLAVSGDEAIKTELKQFIEKLNDSRFTIFMTNENNVTNWESFLKKIFDAISTVTTPYVIINGADDVIIPEAAYQGTKILSDNADIAAIKGYTVCLDRDSKKLIVIKDSEILDEKPIKRIKEALKDRDSIFYIIRRTKDLVTEYQNIIQLSKQSSVVRDSPYHIEHFKALSAAALGKVCVFKSPWRLYNVHNNNSSSYINAAFVRVQLPALDKTNYEWFKSVNKNMCDLSYSHYKFLWVLHQIRGVSITFRQIGYHYLRGNCSLLNSIKIFSYLVLHKIFVLSKKCFSHQSNFLNVKENFFNREHYELLKQHYFSKEDIQLIESEVWK